MNVVKVAVRMAVLGELARSRRAAVEAKPERMATAWAFRLARFARGMR